MCLVCPCLDNARTGDMTECTGKTIRNGCPKLFKTLSQPMAAEWLGQRRRMRAEHRTEYWWLLMCQELLWLSIMNMYSNPARENRPQPTRSNSGCFISHRCPCGVRWCRVETVGMIHLPWERKRKKQRAGQCGGRAKRQKNSINKSSRTIPFTEQQGHTSSVSCLAEFSRASCDLAPALQFNGGFGII